MKTFLFILAGLLYVAIWSTIRIAVFQWLYYQFTSDSFLNLIHF